MILRIIAPRQKKLKLPRYASLLLKTPVFARKTIILYKGKGGNAARVINLLTLKEFEKKPFILYTQ
jgi:hypothetical protein